jgi:hypothetical protein
MKEKNMARSAAKIIPKNTFHSPSQIPNGLNNDKLSYSIDYQYI